MGNIIFSFMLFQSKEEATRLSDCNLFSTLGKSALMVSIPILYSSLSPKQSYLEAQKHNPFSEGDFLNMPSKAYIDV